jgi:hypothetical protein
MTCKGTGSCLVQGPSSEPVLAATSRRNTKPGQHSGELRGGRSGCPRIFVRYGARLLSVVFSRLDRVEENGDKDHG